MDKIALNVDSVALRQMLDLALHWGINGFWALVILIIGWMASGWMERTVQAGLLRIKAVDPMLRGFFASMARWLILALTGVAVLERLGVQTTSVVAILGAAGLAVGLALQGTLSNLAAGVMLLLFRPFRVGDDVEAGAVSGSIRQVSLFHTQLVTGENIQVMVPNSVLWNAAIRNLSVQPIRKVEILAPLAYSQPVDQVMESVRGLIAADSRIQDSPAPTVLLTRFGEKTAELSVCVWCPTAQAKFVRSDLMAALWRSCALGAPPES